MKIQWLYEGHKREKLLLNDWYAGWVELSRTGSLWTAACQFTRRSANDILPCEGEEYKTKEEAKEALQEQAIVKYIGMTDAEKDLRSHKEYQDDTVCKTQ